MMIKIDGELERFTHRMAIRLGISWGYSGIIYRDKRN